MKNKPGFKVNIGGETLLYLVIGIIIFAFVLFMPRIYKFVSDIKTGNAFKGNKNPVVENKPSNNKKEPNEDDKIVEPTGDSKLVCTSTTSTADGNLVETYTFYYTADKLTSFKNEKNYDAISDDYLNYVYSEQARYASINNLYKTVPGFSYSSTFESRNLIATFVYDLTKLNPASLNNGDASLSISLDVTKDQTLEEVKNIYTGLGFVCK